jgi:hypothetical protein
MSRVARLAMVVVLVLIAGAASADGIWFSPLNATSVGPNGPPSLLQLRSGPHFGTSLEVSSISRIAEEDGQFVLVGLTVPQGAVIKKVKVCYDVDINGADSTGTFISQVRLIKMLGPKGGRVIFEDSNNLNSITGQCRTLNVDKPLPEVNGSLTLAMKVVFGSTLDAISIGGIELITQ